MYPYSIYCSRLAILFSLCSSNSALILYKLLIVSCMLYNFIRICVCLHMHKLFLFSNSRSVYYNELICFYLHMYIFLYSLIGCYSMFVYVYILWWCLVLVKMCTSYFLNIVYFYVFNILKSLIEQTTKSISKYPTELLMAILVSIGKILPAMTQLFLPWT